MVQPLDDRWLGILDRGLGIFLVVLAAVVVVTLVMTIGLAAWRLASSLVKRFAEEKLSQMIEARQNARTIAEAVATGAGKLHEIHAGVQGVDKKVDTLIGLHQKR